MQAPAYCVVALENLLKYSLKKKLTIQNLISKREFEYTYIYIYIYILTSHKIKNKNTQSKPQSILIRTIIKVY